MFTSVIMVSLFANHQLYFANTLLFVCFQLWIGFMVFASVTVGVMMVMDVMECFLHTLRLHWVEF